MADDSGVWVKIVPDDFNLNSAPGAAVIDDAASNYDSKDSGVEIDGKKYDIYTFTTATTTFSIRLTDEARARITDEDLLMAVATTNIPNDFDGDPVELFDSRYRDVLRNAFDITPYADPGLSLTIDTPGIVDALIVGGGGGAGGSINNTGAAGGGGAGEVFEGTVGLDDGTYDINVGSGGAGGLSPTNGGPTLFGSLYRCVGGGHGGPTYTAMGNSGACGGGGSGAGSAKGGEGLQNLGKNFGYQGGSATTAYTSGGGGGWTSAGQNTPAANKGGSGGAGIVSKINGLNTEYAGGGGGGCHSPGGEGSGSHRGGDGKATGTPGEDAAPNSGSGGGGGGGNGIGGGKGGSGIVIVRVEI